MRISPRRGVILFVAVVFPLTWLVDLVNWWLGGVENLIAFPLLLILAMFVPGLVAAVMLDFVTREGFRFAGLRWGNKRYIAVAYLLMLGISVATYGLTVAMGWGRLDREATTLQSLLGALGITVSFPPRSFLDGDFLGADWSGRGELDLRSR